MHITFSLLDNHSIGESEKLCKIILFYNFHGESNKYQIQISSKEGGGGCNPQKPSPGTASAFITISPCTSASSWIFSEGRREDVHG